MGAPSHNDNVRKPKVKKDGPKVHIVAFIVSLVLTALAFLAVAYEVVPIGFTVPFILGLAVVQAAFQLFVWMHLDQKNHEFPRVGIFSGAFVAFITIFVFIFWVWI